MFKKSLFRAFFLTLGLFTLIGASTELAAASPVGTWRNDITTEFKLMNWKKVPKIRSWSSAQITDAIKVINSRVSTLKRELDFLRTRGAVAARVIKSPLKCRQADIDSYLPCHFPYYRDLSSHYKIQGLSKAGKVVGVQTEFPTVGMAINDVLIHLALDSCGLTNKSRLPACKVMTPAASTYLQATLITQVYYGGPEFLVLDMLKAVDEERLTYAVADGDIVCPGLSAQFDGETHIPLVGKTADASYKITIGNNPYTFSYRETSSAYLRAKLIRLRKDSDGSIYLS